MIRYKHIHRVLYVCCLLFLLWGTAIAVQACLYNGIRGDESLSFMHSNPNLFSFGQVWSHIKQGSDHSFIHASVLQLLFDGLGYHIYVQRGFSFFTWIVFGFVLFGFANKHTGSKLAALFALILSLFSSSGFWLAADGRFYALTALAGLLHVYVFLYFNIGQSWQRHLLLFFIQFISLLINPILGVWHVLLVTSAFFTYSMRETALYMLGAFGAWLIYQMACSGNAFDGYFWAVYSIKPFIFQWDNSLLEWPFRWILVPHFPFASDWIGACFLLLLLIAIAFPIVQKFHFIDFFKKEFVKPFDVVVLVFLFFTVALVLATLVGGIAVWPYRYFAFGYYVVPIWLAGFLYRQTQYHRVAQVVLLLLLCGWFLRLASEQAKVTERRRVWNEWTPATHTDQVVFEEKCDNNYEPFVQAGQLYVRNEHMRAHIKFRYCVGDSLRAQYFDRLSKMGYQIKFVPVVK